MLAVAVAVVAVGGVGILLCPAVVGEGSARGPCSYVRARTVGTGGSAAMRVGVGWWGRGGLPLKAHANV